MKLETPPTLIERIIILESKMKRLETLQNELKQTDSVEPQPKKIDLSALIESGIDCEFRESDIEIWRIGSLRRIINSVYLATEFDGGNKQCRPRMSHYHGWKGGDKCPLPEGFMVEIYYNTINRRYTETPPDQRGVDWSDVIGFEILGIADGYRMPWEEER